MMIKKLLILLFLPFLTTSVIAEAVAYKLKGDLKSKGFEAIEVSATPLIDSKEIIKSNEDQIIDNNENFIVLNKASGISVQGGTKSKKNLVDIFAKSEIFHGTKPYSVHR